MLTCWIYRRLISESLDTDQALTRSVQRHLQNCPGCREFSAHGKRLAEGLAFQAWREGVPISPFLHGRIMASLDKPDVRAMPGLLRPAWSIAALVFCLVSASAFFFMLHEPMPLDSSSHGLASQKARFAANLLAAAAQLPAENALLEWGIKLDKPLETEMKSVIEDARTALVGVVHNFLPDESSLLR